MSKIPYGIRSVKIENFRCIDKLELDFTDPQGNPSDIVVIGGPNGCGKTAVLEACLLALGGRKSLESKHANALRLGADQSKVDIELIHKTGTESKTNNYQLTIKKPVEILESRDGGQTQTPVDGEPRFSWSYNDEATDSPTPIPCVYFPSWRSPKLVGAMRVSVGKNKRPNDTENQLPNIKQRLIDSKVYALMEGNNGVATAVYDVVLDMLNQVWKRFYPWKSFDFTVGPAGATSEDGFDVHYTSNGVKLPVDTLSAGQLELFKLFGSLLWMETERGIIFIDEPELHLDPQWHAALLHELRRFLPQVQFIVATHSPRIYESVYSYQRHFLIPEDDPRARAWKIVDKEAVPA